MFTQTRLFIIGICIVFLVLRSNNQEPKNTTPVKEVQRVENSVTLTELEELCAENTGWRVNTTFEDEVWCYNV